MRRDEPRGTIDPPPTSTKIADATRPGAAIRFRGSQLGGRAGTLALSAQHGGFVDAPIHDWSEWLIEGLVSAAAATGPVELTTAAGQPVPTSPITVLATANDVDTLAAPNALTMTIGKRSSLTVVATYARRPPAGRLIFLLDGTGVQAARADQHGRARFTVGSELVGELLVYSGRRWRIVRVNWTPPTVASIGLQIRRTRSLGVVTLVASLRTARDAPVEKRAS